MEIEKNRSDTVLERRTNIPQKTGGSPAKASTTRKVWQKEIDEAIEN